VFIELLPGNALTRYNINVDVHLGPRFVKFFFSQESPYCFKKDKQSINILFLDLKDILVGSTRPNGGLSAAL
jgi:hypothetical protein